MSTLAGLDLAMASAKTRSSTALSSICGTREQLFLFLFLFKQTVCCCESEEADFIRSDRHTALVTSRYYTRGQLSAAMESQVCMNASTLRLTLRRTGMAVKCEAEKLKARGVPQKTIKPRARAEYSFLIFFQEQKVSSSVSLLWLPFRPV